MDKISIVIPCYNEEEALEYFYAEMKKVMKKMKEVAFELLFVDDGSEDQTLWEGSSYLCRPFPCLRELCGNYGCRPSGSSRTPSGNVSDALLGELGLCGCPKKKQGRRAKAAIFSV